MDWKQELNHSIRNIESLSEYVEMTAEERTTMQDILEHYPLAVTPYYLSLIDFADEHDPIRKMAIPSIRETDLSGSMDTSGEADNTVISGLQHKYRETALILSTSQCAMYCRHCFRKRFVGLSDDEIAKRFEKMRDYILQHTEINNVILSGGDALLNSNERLDHVLSLLEGISHIDTIRIGTRTPVVLPSRITEDPSLIELLRKHTGKKQLYFMTQFNHPRELTPEAIGAVSCVRKLGIPVRNQSVLLKGVNDDAKVLGVLLRQLVKAGVEPYYVFQCRPVTGVKNQFQIPITEACTIIEQAKAMQNGLGKCFKFCMSTTAGKIEVVGEAQPGTMLFKYHEAADEQMLGKLFTQTLSPGQTWL